jgi:hypothetical protein
VRAVALALAWSLTAVMVFGPGPAVAADQSVTNAVESLAFDLADRSDSEAADFYKFLHQAIFGPGHAIPDRAAAMSFLADELEGLGPPLPGEEPCRTLGGDPILVRVHLRPFVADGGDPEALVEAFVATAEQVHGSPNQMTEAIALAVKWLHSDRQKELATKIEKLGRDLAKQDYPAIHHSQAYIEAYKPAYRVVAAELAAPYGWCSESLKR